MKTDTPQKKKSPSAPKAPTATQPSRSYFPWIVKNTMALAVVAIFLYHFVFSESSGQPGYQWAVHTTLYQNYNAMKQIKAQTRGTLDDRFMVKLGASYEYLYSIKASTPEDAVILLPGRDAFFPQGEQSVFQGKEPYNKLWATRFLYPRRVVIPSELGKTSWSEKITHVAIAYGNGYEYLDYEVTPQHAFAVIPTQPQNQ